MAGETKNRVAFFRQLSRADGVTDRLRSWLSCRFQIAVLNKWANSEDTESGNVHNLLGGHSDTKSIYTRTVDFVLESVDDIIIIIITTASETVTHTNYITLHFSLCS
jgi:hypothetical protein